MNRTDRLLAIILELQRHRVQRAEDLAATFETSKRTIYRDIEALAESGVPVISTPGHGYSLIEGYFLPPLSFNTDEAMMLLLGADAMAQTFDAQYQKSAKSAAAKIEAVLSKKMREDVQTLQVSLLVISSITPNNDVVLERLQALRRAILECRRVRFRYFARFADQSAGAPREVEPHSLAFVERNWYLAALDLKSNAVRRFRLERMEDVTVLAQTFDRPTLETLQNELGMNRQNELNVTVRALFDASVARWVRESRSWFADAEEDTPAGLVVTFKVRHEDELLQYLLQWGSKAQVIEPASLREHIRAEAEAMLRAMSDPPPTPP